MALQLALIPLLPAAAFALLAPMPRIWRNRLRYLSLAAIAGALGFSVRAFLAATASEHGDAVFHVSHTIAEVGRSELEVGLLLDPVSAVMLLVVTIVGICVQIYSLGYMHLDERVGWYYAVLSLFSAAMLAVVLADNFLMLYMAWEVMGLCSYLLIGFWHTEEAPRRASIKAFLTTRVGDVGFALALAVMWTATGGFAFAAVLPMAEHWAPGVATAVALLLLVGAMGKSAQFPLHVWLPDAMAGPTPASALIHAATMVAAGVYLVARALPIFEASGVALTVTLAVGAVTAFLGASLAMVQHDVKKVLAYSTISQLGYMFLGLGAGSAVAGMFHLMTHAFFKSLLFLGAGMIIHAAHTQDMREMGGLRKLLPWTTGAFTVGALALAGVPPFSGFWSKDEILASLLHEHHYVAFAVALVTAFITAFYVSRLWFRVFSGPLQGPKPHEAHHTMRWPAVFLAVLAAVAGLVAMPFARFLGHEVEPPALPLLALSTGVALSGIALGWWFFGRTTAVVNTRALKRRFSYLYGPLEQKLYLDLTYDHFLVRPFGVVSGWLSVFDGRVVDGVVNGAAAMWRSLSDAWAAFDGRVIDGAVNGTASLVKKAGSAARRIQAGRVQVYQRLVLAALMLLVVWVVLKGV